MIAILNPMLISDFPLFSNTILDNQQVFPMPPGAEGRNMTVPTRQAYTQAKL